MSNDTTQISEKNPGDTTTIEGRTYTLNCDGEVGDMLYLTDLDYDADNGHNIAEVQIFGSGKCYHEINIGVIRRRARNPKLRLQNMVFAQFRCNFT